jgi:hypothetical protein
LRFGGAEEEGCGSELGPLDGAVVMYCGSSSSKLLIVGVESSRLIWKLMSKVRAQVGFVVLLGAREMAVRAGYYRCGCGRRRSSDGSAILDQRLLIRNWIRNEEMLGSRCTAGTE